MSGVDEQQDDEFRCPDCRAVSFIRTAYGYRTIRVDIETSSVVKGDWGNEDTDGWECANCGVYIDSGSSLGERLYQLDRGQT